MGKKLPWIKFFTADWFNDPALTLCTPATRGVWIDLICAMHTLDQSGELRGTADQMARFARCSTVEFVQAMTDLQTNRAADVAERNGVYRICNRRMAAAYKSRKSIADRVKRHRQKGGNVRCNAGETAQKSEVRSQNSSSSSVPASNRTAKLPPNWATATTALREEGVRKADDACLAAFSKGCQCEEVLDVVCFYRLKKPAWDAEDLYYRVLDMHPHDDCSKRWRPSAAESQKVGAGYLPINADAFRQYVVDKKFKDGPQRNTSDPHWVYGTLRDGTKVECKDYPVKGKT